MAIEFVCPECQSQLRVPDGTEGQVAQCPHCDARATIPGTPASTTTPPDALDEDAVPAPPPPPPAAPAWENAMPRYEDPALKETNPYASPTSDIPLTMNQVDGTLEARHVSVSDVLSVTWTIMSVRLRHCLVFGLMLIALYAGSVALTAPFNFLIGAMQDQGIAVIAPLQLLSIVWSQIVTAALVAVALKYALNIARGSTRPIDGIFNVSPILLRVIGGQILSTCVMMAIGAVAALVGLIVALFVFGIGGRNNPESIAGLTAGLMIAGAFLLSLIVIAVSTRLAFLQMFIVDRNEGVFSSFSLTLNYTRGNALTIFLLWLIVGIGGGLAMLFTLFFGIVVVAPFVLLAFTVTYLIATGQMDPQQPILEPAEMSAEV